MPTKRIKRTVGSLSEWEAAQYCRQEGYRGVPVGYALVWLKMHFGNGKVIYLTVGLGE